ncbi:DUF120 domain-containing protein [Thermococcus stetteri]|uniref:DUF120 domain-containing protein n=1 Tax=Thermococcus stetteri TaxID=49900 RepID=UPI001AE177EF|nr:DUF120 domain-containing protein [Thermococcus stetteri]MBP1912497.1 riboflavin kinase [Thermococcus stetteri]
MKKILMLIQLSKRNAIGKPVRVTMRELADALNTSPHTVLRILAELENEGLIERRTVGKKTYVEILPEGLNFLKKICDEILEAVSDRVIVGEVVSGLGEGAYYVKQYSPLIEEYLGFKPFPGTLNVKMLFPKTVFDAVLNVRPVIIPGFVKDGRLFGDVRAYRVQVNGIEGAIVVPSRTIHPPRIAEIVAPVNLRKTLKLKDGDRVRIEVIQ